MEDIVTPWETSCDKNGFKYDRLITKFGVKPITSELLNRFEKVTNVKPHRWLTRGLFFAHRDLEKILDAYENSQPIFLYTGRGPSSKSLHLGHMIPFMFMQWLQQVFNAFVVIQISDDEKYQFSKDPNLDFTTIHQWGYDNIADIKACNFITDKTFIFSNHDYSRYCPHVYPFLMEMMKHMSVYNIQDTFFGKEDKWETMNIYGSTVDLKIKERKNCTVGQLLWPIQQSAASFAKFYPQLIPDNALCLVIYAIDQDPYFRDARDVASKIHQSKPCSIMSKFLPALNNDGKMSSSGKNPNFTIFMDDTKEDIATKIKKYAISGGRSTLEEHQKLGGSLDIDISYQYLQYFLESDSELQSIANAYSSGKMTTSEIKKITIDVISDIVGNHQRNKNIFKIL